jgi:hypothetical protein
VRHFRRRWPSFQRRFPTPAPGLLRPLASALCVTCPTNALRVGLGAQPGSQIDTSQPLRSAGPIPLFAIALQSAIRRSGDPRTIPTRPRDPAPSPTIEGRRERGAHRQLR